MHPAAIVEGVILLLQHQHLTLVPALVVRTHVLYPQGGLAVQTGPAWLDRDRDEVSAEKGQRKVRRTEGNEFNEGNEGREGTGER